MIRLFLATTILLSGQDDIAQAVRSPFDLQRYIDSHRLIDWKPLWTAMGINGDEVWIPSCGDSSGRHQRECWSELIEILQPRQVILRIHHDPSMFEAYVRFLPTATDAWRFAGAFAPNVKYFEPRHKLIRFGDKPFLLLSGQGVSGSGLSSEYQQWFDLTLPDLKAIFGFTQQGTENRYGLGISREVHGTVVSIETEPTEAIRIAWMATLTTETPNGTLQLGPLLSGSSTYSRRGDNFEFDEHRSETPKAEVEGLYESIGDDGFEDQDRC